MPIFERVKWPGLKPNVLSSHWQKRIGFYSAVPSDRWWSLRDPDEADSAMVECIALLTAGLREMAKLDSTRALISYWQSGGWGGLSAKQRENYLRISKDIA